MSGISLKQYHARGLLRAWAHAVCTAVMLMTVHADAVGTYDAEVAAALNEAVEEMLCAFERLPEAERGGADHD